MYVALIPGLQILVDINEAIIKWFHNSLGFGWGMSIIGLTVVIRLAILPLTYRQVRGMQEMQRLAPEMKKIQERYKEDKQRQQQELMKFYQEHNFNPLSSCLPLLLQLPFFISLYQLQRSAEFKEDVGGQGFLFISHLTEKATGGALAALIVLYIATQLGSSLVTTINIQDQNQKRLMLALPFLFTLFIVNFPAGLVLYWITTNLWTVGQQLAVRRFLPAPEPLDTSKSKPARAGSERAKPARASGSKADDGKPARKGFLAAAAERQQAKADARSKGGDGKSSAAGKSSGDGGNGRPAKAPPPSPRKKKKRSGRRR
jgi:YidC/Oxa1 family membrane protein insertase